jgi:hypothetical protein
MDLIDRYLHAVRRNLPAAKANDIAAELRDDLMTRKEDREEALGRPMSRDETAALIKEFGHPLIVASRYRQQQWLIGPEVFPFYIFVMRIVLLIVAGVVVAVGVGSALFGSEAVFKVFGQTIGSLWATVLANIAIITIVFAVMERAGFPADYLSKWKPDQLPDVKDEQPGPWHSAFEVAAGIALLLWWTGAIVLPHFAQGPDFRLEMAPVWSQYYWPILALFAARLVYNIVQWLRPRWAAVRLLLGGATAIGGIALLGFLYQAGQWATVVSTGMPAAKAAELQTSLNLSLKIAIVAVGVVLTFQCLTALWKLVRGRLEGAGR